MKRWIGIALVVLMWASRGVAQGPTYVARINGSQQDLPVVYLPDLEKFPYISAQDLADILNLRTFYSEKARKVILYIDDLEIKFTAMNPFVTVGNKVLQLPIEARYAEGDIYLPLPFSLELLAPYYHGTIQLAQPQQATLINEVSRPPAPAAHADGTLPIAANLVGLRVEEKTNGTLIRIQTNQDFQSAHINSRLTRGWLYIDIYGGRVDTSAFSHFTPAGVIKRVVPVQLAQMAQLSFQLRGEISSRKVYTDNMSREILVSLATQTAVSNDVLKALESERRKWLIDTIVLDPGHGGRDPGAIGPGGTYEKDVTLALCRQVKELLEKKSDVRVVMTRADDRFVPLKDRTRLANHEQGKLFISIHANSNKSTRITGLTSYFLGPAETEEAIEVAKRENAVINYEQDNASYAEFDTESFILLALAQNAYQRESQELAALVQSCVAERTDLKDRGIKQAGYYVLIGASMPNILIEVAFISNPGEEKLLNGQKFQRRVAEGICESILRFKKKYEKEIN